MYDDNGDFWESMAREARREICGFFLAREARREFFGHVIIPAREARRKMLGTDGLKSIELGVNLR
jgi:hypothetical protein